MGDSTWRTQKQVKILLDYGLYSDQPVVDYIINVQLYSMNVRYMSNVSYIQ